MNRDKTILAMNMAVVVVAMTSLSGAAYMGRQMSRRDEEFHQTLIVLSLVVNMAKKGVFCYYAVVLAMTSRAWNIWNSWTYSTSDVCVITLNNVHVIVDSECRSEPPS